MENTENSGGRNASEAEKVADISKARAKRDGKSKSKCGRCVEARFADSLLAGDDFAIAGRTQDRSIDLSLYRWAGTHWRILEDAEAHREFYAWARDSEPGKLAVRYAAGAVDTAAEMLLDEPGHDLAQMRARGVVIPTPDGYLRLEDDGRIFVDPIDRAAGITYCVPARIDTSRVRERRYEPVPVPSGSTFGKYLDRFLPDLEVRNLLQEACASTLLPKCFEKALVLTGSGSNGKSTLLHLLRALHPANAALRLDQIRGRFGLQEVPGRTLLIASETPSFLGSDVEQALKAIISRDPITIEMKRKNSRTITPRATLVISANEPIRFVDRTYGSERKYLHIPFSVQLPEDSPERITDYYRWITDDPAEMTALLDWLLVGARRLLTRGRFPDPPAAVQALVTEQKMQTDTVFAWLTDYDVQARPDYQVPKVDVYRHYRDAVLDGSGKPVGDRVFWLRMREHFGDAFVESRPCGINGRERVANVYVPGLRTGRLVG